jgi:multiple sugar transport system substrate-binding protein
VGSERVRLRGITWDHPRGLDSVRGAANAWALAGGKEIAWDVRSLQGFADASLEVLVDQYDLLVIDHPHIPHAAKAGLLVPVDTVGRDPELATLAAQSVGPSHSTYEHEGHQYGLAIDAATQVAVYRPDVLSQPPTTWDEVFALAEEGRVLWPSKPVDAISSFLTLAANRGAAIAGEGFIDTDEGLAVLDRLHHLAALVPPICLGENPIETAEHLAGEEAWAYAPLAFGYTNYSRAGFRRHRLAYTDMPRGRRGVAGSCLGGAGIAVSSRSAHAAEAVDFAFWVASAEVQRGVYYASGGQPGNAVAWDDDAVNADCLDFFRSTRATLEGAWVRPRFDSWLEVQDEVGLLINRALRQEIDDLACLREADEVLARAREGEEARRR